MLKQVIQIIFATFLAVASKGQPNASVETNWGPDSDGLKMSIKLQTNAIAIGSEILLQAWITNSSPNPVFVIFVNRETSATVYLTNNLGRFYDLTPRSKVPTPIIGRFEDPIGTHELYAWNLSLKCGKQIETGNYELKAVRYFMLEPGSHSRDKVVSNSLQVKIVSE